MSTPKKTIQLSRDCPAVKVPDGILGLLQAKETVTLQQAMGDSFSVLYQGNLYRVEGEHADALGLTVATNIQTIITKTNTSLDEKITLLLKTIYDPEIPVNILDLGLIYGWQIFAIDPEQENNPKKRLHLTMTLTAPGCGMGPFLVEEVKRKLSLLPPVADTVVELVFDPPWSHDKMSAEAKLQLGLIY
jgi:probable FeS assembly SUF system protein SufT